MEQSRFVIREQDAHAFTAELLTALESSFPSLLSSLEQKEMDLFRSVISSTFTDSTSSQELVSSLSLRPPNRSVGAGEEFVLSEFHTSSSGSRSGIRSFMPGSDKMRKRNKSMKTKREIVVAVPEEILQEDEGVSQLSERFSAFYTQLKAVRDSLIDCYLSGTHVKKASREISASLSMDDEESEVCCCLLRCI